MPSTVAAAGWLWLFVTACTAAQNSTHTNSRQGWQCLLTPLFGAACGPAAARRLVRARAAAAAAPAAAAAGAASAAAPAPACAAGRRPLLRPLRAGVGVDADQQQGRPGPRRLARTQPAPHVQVAARPVGEPDLKRACPCRGVMRGVRRGVRAAPRHMHRLPVERRFRLHSWTSRSRARAAERGAHSPLLCRQRRRQARRLWPSRRSPLGTTYSTR
jgi:hypothetical protein